MHRYYGKLITETNLSRKAGSNVIVSPQFRLLSSLVISQCSFIQNLIQQIIFTSHGSELANATNALKTFPSPKARLEFLCEFPYKTEDVVVKKVFDFARINFRSIYEIRNVLVHEVWASSDEHPGSVLFSSLDEHSRLLMISGRVWHKNDTAPREVYDATIRFIRSVKVATCNHLELALKDIDVCSWSLMHIVNILGEQDAERKSEARRAFFVFGGTSHLFEESSRTTDPVTFTSKKTKKIS